MNSSSTNLVYVDAAGWIALVNRRDVLHTQAVRIYRQLLQEQCQFMSASVVLLEVGNCCRPLLVSSCLRHQAMAVCENQEQRRAELNVGVPQYCWLNRVFSSDDPTASPRLARTIAVGIRTDYVPASMYVLVFFELLSGAGLTPNSDLRQPTK